MQKLVWNQIPAPERSGVQSHGPANAPGSPVDHVLFTPFQLPGA